VLPNDARIRQVPGPVARYCCGCRLLYSLIRTFVLNLVTGNHAVDRQYRPIATLPRLPLHRNPPLRGPHGRARPRIAARARAAPAAHGSSSLLAAGTAASAYFPARIAAVRVGGRCRAVRSRACWATSAAAPLAAARVVDGAPMSASSPCTPTGPPPRPVRCGPAPTERNTITPRPRRPTPGPTRCGWSTPVREDAIDVGAIIDVRPRGGRCQRRLDTQVLGCAEVRISLTTPGRILLAATRARPRAGPARLPRLRRGPREGLRRCSRSKTAPSFRAWSCTRCSQTVSRSCCPYAPRGPSAIA
jgi:hypothetical protein